MGKVDPKEVEALKAKVLQQLDGNAWNQVRVAWAVEENDAQHEGRLPTIPTLPCGGQVGGGGEPPRAIPSIEKARRKPAKIDIAVTIKTQHPTWDDAAIARAVPCDKSLLCRNKKYRDAAQVIEAAYCRLPADQKAALDARTGEYHPASGGTG